MFEIKRATKFAERIGGNSNHQPESESLIDNIEDGSSNESDNGIRSNTYHRPLSYKSSNNPFKKFNSSEEFDFHQLVNEPDKTYAGSDTASSAKTDVEPNLPKGLNRFKNIAKNTSLPEKTDTQTPTSNQSPSPVDVVIKIDDNISNNPPSAINRFKSLAKKTDSVPKDTNEKLNASTCIPSEEKSLNNSNKGTREPLTGPPTGINRFKSLAKKTSLPLNKDTATQPKETIIPSNMPVKYNTTDPTAPNKVADNTNKSEESETCPPKAINRFKNLAKKTSSDVEGIGTEVNKVSSKTDVPKAMNRFKSLAKKTSAASAEEPGNDLNNMSSVNNGIVNANITKPILEIGNEEKLPAPSDQQPPNFMSLVTTVTTVNKVSKIGRRKMRDKLKEQMKKIVEERLSVKQIFARYVEASTLHGFRYTCMETYLIRRVFWAILMIFGFIYFLWKLEGGIREYLSYPFSTLSTLDYVDQVHYPAISICIINQFRYSKILENPRMKELYMQGRLPLRRNWSDISFINDIPGNVLLNDIKNTSFSLADILKGCDYIRRDTEMPESPVHSGKNPCGRFNFTSYFSDSGQLCYRLNSQEPGHSPLKVSFSGLRYGFDLIFDLDNNDTIMNNDFVALQVIIHDPNEPPQSNSGFMIAPGFKTYVSMQRVETSNLRPPYDTQCGERELKYFKTYHQKACLLEKLTNYTAEKCNCREPFMPDNGLELCSLRETITCMYPARESFNEFDERMGCPVDCQVITYKSKVSTARFLHNPPIGIEEAILSSTIGKHGNETTEGHVFTLLNQLKERELLGKHIEENVIVVLFFFGDMTIIKNEQEVSFDFYQFLGDMGGEIGLMLGASLLTFVEFIDLFLFLIYHQLLRLNKVKKEKDRKESNISHASGKRKSIRDSIFGKKDSVGETEGKRKSKDMLIPKKDSSAMLLPKKESLGILIPRQKSSGTENELKKRNGKVPWLDKIKAKQDPEMGNLNLVPKPDSLPTKPDSLPTKPDSLPTKPDSLPTKYKNPAIPTSEDIKIPIFKKMNGNVTSDQRKNIPKYKPEYSELGYREGSVGDDESTTDANKETYI